MAKRVVDLLTSTLKYPDGTPVQCVIADSTIGRVADVNTDFFEEYLGMRCEGVDEVEIIRRMTHHIFADVRTDKSWPTTWFACIM